MIWAALGLLAGTVVVYVAWAWIGDFVYDITKPDHTSCNYCRHCGRCDR